MTENLEEPQGNKAKVQTKVSSFFVKAPVSGSEREKEGKQSEASAAVGIIEEPSSSTCSTLIH